MKDIIVVSAGVCGLGLTIWALLRHRREEVAQYPLSWKGWCVRLALVVLGIAVLCFARGDVWAAFPGIAMIVLPLLYRQIPYEIATRLFPSDNGVSGTKT